MSGFEQILLYSGFGLAIVNAILPTLKKISKSTPTKVDDTLIQYLEDGLQAANAIRRITKEQDDCGKEGK